MVDWDVIEATWRFGDKSNVVLARGHGISEGAIRKRAKREGWEKGQKGGPRQPTPPPQERQAPVVAPPPGDKPLMETTIDVAGRMLDELSAVTASIGELEELIYDDTEDDRDGRRRAALLKAVSLNTRAMTLKTLQQTLEAAQAAIETPTKGKKAQKAAAAKEVAAAGKFGASRPPLHSVK